MLCDTDALATLPPRELRSGQGELAKYHFLTGDDLLALDLAERIAAAVRIKADVVAGDEREDPDNRRGRAILNYGHTLAHALEIETAHDLRHGEAVGIGLAYAAALARRLGRIDDDRVAEHHRVLAAYELDAALPAGRRPRSTGGRSWAATRRPSAGSPSCSTVPTASRSSPASTRPTPAPPWRTSRDRSDRAAAERPEPQPARASASRRSTAPPPSTTTSRRRAPSPRRTASRSSTSSRTTRATSSTPSRARAGRCAAIVINAGALTHYGRSIHDALATFDGPIVELHLSNPAAREAWRHPSVIAPVATGVIAGLGGHGYPLAVAAVVRLLE